MKTIEKSKIATNPTEKQNAKLISVVVGIPAKKLKPYEDFAKKFDILTSHVVEGEVYTELDGLGDQAFANLEWFDNNCGKQNKLKSITLEFSPNVYALIARVAHLLRRTIPELTACLATSASGLLAGRLEDAKSDISELEECVETVKFARQFHERALRNDPPIGPTKRNGWESLCLIDPDREEAA
jgi:hypothetical protein